MSLSTEEVGVPHAQQATDDGDVLLQRCLLEVLVHGISTSQELVEVVEANIQGHAQTDGTPHTVSATDPVGESKHVLLVNTELSDF